MSCQGGRDQGRVQHGRPETHQSHRTLRSEPRRCTPKDCTIQARACLRMNFRKGGRTSNPRRLPRSEEGRRRRRELERGGKMGGHCDSLSQETSQQSKMNPHDIGNIPPQAPAVKNPSKHVDGAHEYPEFGMFVQDPPEGISARGGQSPSPAAFASSVEASQGAERRGASCQKENEGCTKEINKAKMNHLRNTLVPGPRPSTSFRNNLSIHNCSRPKKSGG